MWKTVTVIITQIIFATNFKKVIHNKNPPLAGEFMYEVVLVVLAKQLII